MSDDDDAFLSYLRQNSMFNPKFKQLSRQERRIGRKKPRYCELHEYMILKPADRLPPQADHNHKTGKYRGWICHGCNTRLLPEIDRLKNEGISSEDIKTFLRLAVDYVFTDGKVLDKVFSNRKLK